MPKYRVYFSGEVEIEAECALEAECSAAAACSPDNCRAEDLDPDVEERCPGCGMYDPACCTCTPEVSTT